MTIDDCRREFRGLVVYHLLVIGKPSLTLEPVDFTKLSYEKL